MLEGTATGDPVRLTPSREWQIIPIFYHIFETKVYTTL